MKKNFGVLCCVCGQEKRLDGSYGEPSQEWGSNASHGYCPPCAQQALAEIREYREHREESKRDNFDN